MERLVIDSLKKWKNRSSRKPLILRGARQVGKTWLIKEFGKREYAKIAYINFEDTKHLQSIFLVNYDIKRIIDTIQIETNINITAEDTLIVFDEIQEAEGALTSLKYFCENAPQYHIIAAGSLLGISLHGHVSFPVGKVEFLDIYPFSFTEFLLACGQKPLLDILNRNDWEMIKQFKERLIGFLRHYYYIGGMPEVVQSFINNNDMYEVRTIQKQILSSYEQDFSKHAPIEIVPRIRMLWNSIPTQLSHENKKFIYGAIKQGSRAKDYELALSWLIDTGLVYKINRVSKPDIPLIAYEDVSAFKLFIVDVGLLSAMGDLDVKTIIDGNSIFEEFKGALTEQYVLQQLKSIENIVINYWTSESSRAELDFLIQYSGKVIPIEVKAEENLQAKSLRVFCTKYSPQMALRTSMSDFRKETWLTNIPLYAISNFLTYL